MTRFTCRWSAAKSTPRGSGNELRLHRLTTDLAIGLRAVLEMTTRASGDEVLVEKMAKALWNSYGRTAGVPKWGKAPEWKKEMARAGIRAALDVQYRFMAVEP